MPLLVADLEGESQKLVSFLGLEWEPACLEFHRTQRTVATASSWQVRQPLYDRSVGRWRNYERHLAPLLRAGYLVLCDRYIFTAFARDVVRGCPPEWVRGIYSFAPLPDLTFFFKADLEVSLQRILDGRPQLKYFEAGMDLRLSQDPYESFRIFQGRILEQYLAMSTEFNFLVIDANQLVEKQQSVVRELVSQRLGLKQFRRAEPLVPIPAAEPPKRVKREVAVE